MLTSGWIVVMCRRLFSGMRACGRPSRFRGRGYLRFVFALVNVFMIVLENSLMLCVHLQESVSSIIASDVPWEKEH